MPSSQPMFASRPAAVAAALFVVACSGGGGSPAPPGASRSRAAPADGAPSAVASSPSVDEPAAADGATYRVPVPAELEPYATYELSDLRFRERGQEWTLEYSLPALLVGDDQKVSFRGASDAEDEYVLRGDIGEVTCRNTGGVVHCDEALSGVQLDAQKLERALSELPAEQREGRRAVADRFADDPIGVLTFPH